MLENRRSHYRWYLLGLTMATYGVITGLNRMCMPVLFKQISEDLNLSLVAIGVKRTLIVICILAGVFGAVRGLTVNFVTMAASMFLFGLMAAATPSVVPKLTAEWFSGRQLGLANALIYVAFSVGAMAATMLSTTVLAPALGGWRNVLFLYGAPAVLLGLLWLTTGREPPKRELPEAPPVNTVPFRQAVIHILHIKQVWIMGLITLTAWGSNMGFIGYLPLYLRGLGWSNAAADVSVTLISGLGMLGAIPMVVIADRTSRRKVITMTMIILSVTTGLLPMASGTAIWALIIMGGFLRSGAQAIYTVMIFETEGVGSAYGGTAIGLANSLAMLGAFGSPPLGNSFTHFSPGAPMYFWGALAAFGLPLLYMVKDRPVRLRPDAV
jgi:MFS family permease